MSDLRLDFSTDKGFVSMHMCLIPDKINVAKKIRQKIVANFYFHRMRVL
jgi:hypothetical protein